MALIASTSSSSILNYLSYQRKPPSTTLCFKSKLTKIPQDCISNDRFILKQKRNFTSKTQTPICKYGDASKHAYDNENQNKATTTSLTMPVPVPESESYAHRIWWSNVEVKKPKKVFVRGRKWNLDDRVNLIGGVMLHVIALFAPFAFNWGAVWVAVTLHVVTGMLGITLSYHRNLSHKSFKLPKWLEYSFAYCGVLAFQRDPIFWVSTHRHHHQFVDSEQDPHTPVKGFWYSHFKWLFDTNAITEECGEKSNVRDLEEQAFYRFIRRTYFLHQFLLAFLLYALGGFPCFVWGMGVRSIFVYHLTAAVKSICHIWGNQAWNTGDLSKNNWWVALLTFGEGWHNNHHAFEYSARHGLEWWQIDKTWYIVKILQLLGLATDVKLPKEDHKQRLAFLSE